MHIMSTKSNDLMDILLSDVDVLLSKFRCCESGSGQI